MRSCLRVAIGLGAYSTLAAAEPPITIERLLDQGWDLAGYGKAFMPRAERISARRTADRVLR